ncbi:MAG: hypothetical protein A4E19_18405 [Nitrospira sp. SG-bin1]|nr:MAG: hypothetical protein A4E19_18405 [Nitrospira sp. SG-bin1]
MSYGVVGEHKECRSIDLSTSDKRSGYGYGRERTGWRFVVQAKEMGPIDFAFARNDAKTAGS